CRLTVIAGAGSRGHRRPNPLEGMDGKMDGELQVLRLGRVEYEDGLTLMARYGAARREGKVPDTLLLLEHPPVLTMGRSAESANVVTPPEILEAMGIRVHETNRGGDVTYHGPGWSRVPRSPDRKGTRLNLRHVKTTYDVFCLKKKNI